MVWSALIAMTWGSPAEAARRERLDPVGTWSCVVYGHPAFGDEHVLIRIAADGTAAVARDYDRERLWDPLSRWDVDDDQMTFSDSRTGRQFAADLGRGTLGGSWRTVTLVGGWWCTTIDDASFAGVLVERGRKALMPPLMPVRTATPAYPLQAIREAKQGRAVTCFFVDASGNIVRPELIEISDEVFRAPTLAALARSQYQGWDDAGVVRPGCRTYIYRLDQISEVTVVPN